MTRPDPLMMQPTTSQPERVGAHLLKIGKDINNYDYLCSIDSEGAILTTRDPRLLIGWLAFICS